MTAVSIINLREFSCRYRVASSAFRVFGLRCFSIVLAVALLAAADPALADEPKRQALEHSYAQPESVVIKHLDLDLNVDFDTKRLAGSATLHLDRKQPTASLNLDAWGLEVQKVTDQHAAELEFRAGEPNPLLGEGLTVVLKPDTDRVKIEYRTRPEAAALQWLNAKQTSGEHPFLFTQSQAILARTWVPCQDSPAIRMTYSARIKVPGDLLAIMSAVNPQAKNQEGVYQFEMRQPIPAYLLALAVGDLEFQPLGSRSGVYAEPTVIKKAAWELADTERMIAAAEKLYGPYRWDRYDLVILPPSFPFGGMENPRLTFATPTILAGDRSLVALVAHELAHSWSGNLVTNATWNDFWLNEGFTVYFEQRIMESIYGRRYSEMLAKLSLEGLKEELADLDSRDTWLRLDLKNRNPDDGMTSVAYDKGYFFLRRLEESYGREIWDEFLRGYFKKFAFQSMTTDGFLKYLNDELIVSHADKSEMAKADVQAWVFGPGLPDNCPEVASTELENVKKQATAFLSGSAQLGWQSQTKEWSTHHWLHFLRSFEGKLSTEQMQSLDQEFHFTKQTNSEILHDWLLLSIRSGYSPAYGSLRDFLTRQGRRKFLSPLYRELVKTAGGRELARSIYDQARPLYHPISQESIDEILASAK